MYLFICDTREKKDAFTKHCSENKYSKILIVGAGGVGKTYSSRKIFYSYANRGAKVKVYFEPPFDIDDIKYDVTIYNSLNENIIDSEKYDVVGVFINKEC